MTNIAPRLLNGSPKSSIWERRLWGLRFLFQPLETIEARSQAYGDDYRVSQPDATVHWLMVHLAVQALWGGRLLSHSFIRMTRYRL